MHDSRRNELTISSDISYGTIISIVGTLLISILGAIGVYFLFVIRQDKNLSLLTYQVSELTKEISGLKGLISVQIEQNARLVMIERTLDDLRRGEGMIVPLWGKNRTAFGEG